MIAFCQCIERCFSVSVQTRPACAAVVNVIRRFRKYRANHHRVAQAMHAVNMVAIENVHAWLLLLLLMLM